MFHDRVDRGPFKPVVISLSLFAYLALSISIVSASLYDFEDGIGPGWYYDGRVHWYPDGTQSYRGEGSLKSGAIKCTGESSIYRQVEGPADISFWWKKHPSTGPSAKGTVFTFSVNGVVQKICDFSDWRKESYTIPYNGTYEIRWDFRKITCYPQSEGSGWIDEVNITPERPLTFVTSAVEYICPPGPQGEKGEKGDIGPQGPPVSYETTYTFIDNMNDMESLIGSNKIFRDNEIIFIDPPNPGMDFEKARAELELEINSNTNKTIYLREGSYPGNIVISTNNITIAPDPDSNKYVKFDGFGSDIVIGLDNTSNISIIGLDLVNGSIGIAVENSTYCEIKENNIYGLRQYGEYDKADKAAILICNSSSNVIRNNNLGRTYDDDFYGVWLHNSTKNLIKYNRITLNSEKFYHYRFEENSSDNLVILQDIYFSSGNVTVDDNGYKYRLHELGSLIGIDELGSLIGIGFSDNNSFTGNERNKWAIVA